MSYRARHGADAARRRKPVSPDRTRPGALRTLVAAWLDDQAVRHFSTDTIALRQRTVRLFIEWAEERGVTDAAQATAAVVTRYQRWLFHQYRDRSGQPLSPRGQHARLASLRGFFGWCVKRGHLPGNPAADLDLPRQVKHLPRSILSREEIAAVFAQPDLSTAKGLRDRAMLEVLYSTGLRRTELANLKLYDIERDRGLLLVREGKGKKDRFVPLGAHALSWIDRYLADVRPTLVMEPDDGFLFLNISGERFGRCGLGTELRQYIDAAGIAKRGSCHLFRHAFATHLLEAGCDVRFIQEMLGHESLETTAIYTSVTVSALKRVHALFHPSEAPRGPDALALPAVAGGSSSAAVAAPPVLAPHKAGPDSASPESPAI